MKKLSLLLALSVANAANISAASHTFLSPRQITTDPTYELALTDYNIYHAHDDKRFQLYIKPFYQQSTQEKKIAEYFLPNNKSFANVSEAGTGDIDPLWFNVISATGTSYSSNMTFRPVHRAFGGVITFYADLDCLCSSFNRFWLLINTAAMGVENKVNVCESNSSFVGTITGFTNMAQGLDNPAFCYGKVSCKAQKKGGLDDIQVKLGYNAYLCDNEAGHIAPYFVFTIPTGTGPKDHYLFEPLVGSKHASAGVGLNADYVFCDSGDNHFSVLGDLKYRYVFKAKEKRSFDLLNNGDWSRYLLVVTPDQPLNSLPGINYFTQCAEVTPKSTIDFWLAGHYARCNWDVEFGYTLWWRQREKVALKCKNASLGVGIYDLGQVGSQIISSASQAEIFESIANNSVPTDGPFVTETTANLNLCSAEQPAALSNKIYLAGAWHHDSFCNNHPLLLGLGGSYEFGSKCSALSNWGVWFTAGIDF